MKETSTGRRRSTATSNFGSGLREAHDASAFYERFHAPELSDDDTVAPPVEVAEPFRCGDSRNMADVADNSVALVVTSPPYFAGKAYEEELEREGIPASYLEYLDMLRGVFAECVRTLEPGGRIAVNVANLGRRPYRSLSADVVAILEELGLLLRGEVIWQKAEGASGSCAWGSFRSAANPVLRDITERVIVASKGRFDRARTIKQRAAEGLPHRNTLMTEDFMALTLDVWSMPTESAKRVGHPAPFPVELPEQLIRLYTYENDLVLDPFLGSGSTMVAASRLGRRYVGYDLDPDYVDLARRRVLDEGGPNPTDREGFRDHAVREGKAAQKLAAEVLEAAGFTIGATNKKLSACGVVISLVVADAMGGEWLVDVPGGHTTHRGGLLKTETVLRTLGRAAAVGGLPTPRPLLVLTTELPKHRSDGDKALRSAGPATLFDVIDLMDDRARARLAHYAGEGADGSQPLPGFWAPEDLRTGDRS
ncbi:MAG: site-specific DNA-methyltransferase [Microthrixaceae bacterium]